MLSPIKYAFLTVLSFVSVGTYGQNEPSPEPADTVMTLEACLVKAMAGNYDVLLSRNELEIAENRVSLAPFLPKLDASSQLSGSESTARTHQSDGSRSTGSTRSLGVNNRLQASWVLFDGWNMFASYDKQRELLSQGQLSFRAEMEQLVLDLSVQFYHIINLQSQVHLMQELVSISQQRYQQALTRYRIGADSGLEYKQAQIYLNRDSSELLLQMEHLKNAYVDLNRLMNVSLNARYVVSDSIRPLPTIQYESVRECAFRHNTQLQAILLGQRVAALDVQLAQSKRWPSLTASAGYTYNTSRSAYFPDRYDDVNGPNWGVQLSIPLFHGSEIHRAVKEAKLRRKAAELSYDQTRQELEAQLMQEYNLYSNNMRMIDFEEQSRDAAQMNMEAAMEKYRIGSLSGIEFRDYQQSYLDASARKLNALYQTKISEITLQLLMGTLQNKP